MDYEEQLDRALEQSPDIAGSGERFQVPEPEVRQEGNVSVYENFQTTVDELDREDSHVVKYLQNELGTSGHIDESGRARLTGSFTAARIESVVESYAEAYVLCSECGLPDTKLERERGALIIRCEACGARSPTGGD
jgi:translation initiation factor 2 subunit 2